MNNTNLPPCYAYLDISCIQLQQKKKKKKETTFIANKKKKKIQQQLSHSNTLKYLKIFVFQIQIKYTHTLIRVHTDLNTPQDFEIVMTGYCHGNDKNDDNDETHAQTLL